MKSKTLSVLSAFIIIFCFVCSFTVTAVDYYDIPNSYYRYPSEYVYGNARFWYPNLDAYYEFNETTPFYERKPATPYSERFCYFDSSLGDYVESSMAGMDYVYKIIHPAPDTSGTKFTSYFAGDGFYYPTYLLAADHTPKSGKIAEVTKYGDGTYFSVYSGNLYEKYSDALAGSTGNASYIMIYLDGKYYDYRYTPVYFAHGINEYYLSYAEAETNNSYADVLISATPTQGYYFNRASGRFYVSRQDAASGGRDKYVIEATSLAYSNGIFTDSGEYPSHYEDIYIPYNTSGSSDGSSAQKGDAYLYNNKSYAGWQSLADYINSQRDNSAVNINMNNQLTIPKSFFENIKLKKVNVTFINNNGSRFSINGSGITTPKAIDLTVTYSTSTIPAEAVSNYRTGAISSSQFIVGDGSSFGVSGTLNIGFSTARAGKQVKLYRYSPSSKTLSLVDTTTISSSGRAVFDLSSGGEFCAIIMK
jgi:hypothetical protein